MRVEGVSQKIKLLKLKLPKRCRLKVQCKGKRPLSLGKVVGVIVVGTPPGPHGASKTGQNGSTHYGEEKCKPSVIVVGNKSPK